MKQVTVGREIPQKSRRNKLFFVICPKTAKKRVQFELVHVHHTLVKNMFKYCLYLDCTS